MAKFYFDTEVDGVLLWDDEGQELADREAARKEAVLALSEMARGLPSRGIDQNSILTIVRDETGQRILMVTLSLNVEWND